MWKRTGGSGGARFDESEEPDLIRDRHAAALTALAEASEGRLFGDERKAQLDRLELDHDNFRAALDWCIANERTEQALRLAAALWRFWQMRGHLREGRARVEAVLRLPGGDKFPEARRHALEAAGGNSYWQAEMAPAPGLYDQAVVVPQAAGGKRGGPEPL